MEDKNKEDLEKEVTQEDLNKANQAKKQSGEQEQEQEQEQEREMTREEYIKSMRDERYEYEEERDKSKQEWSELDQRMARQQEVRTASLDYNQIFLQSINAIPVSTFKHPSQLFYFISDLRGIITEENLIKCITGFLSLADVVEPESLESDSFLQFIDLVEENIQVISQEQNLVLIGQFLDLYCINNQSVWETYERKVIAQVSHLQAKTLIQILGTFSNQKEGSEFFYINIENMLKSIIEIQIENETISTTKNLKNFITFSDLVAIAQSFYRAQAGSLAFFIKVQEQIQTELVKANLDDLIKLTLIFKNIKNKKEEMFDELENRTLTLIQQENQKQQQNQSNLQEKENSGNQRTEDEIKQQQEQQIQQLTPLQKNVCLLADGFGFEMGSDDLFNQLSTLAIPALQQANTKNELSIFIKGFLYSYRGNQQILDVLKEKLITLISQQQAYMSQNKANKEEMDQHTDVFFSLTELAQIAKSFYLAEYSDKKLEFVLESMVNMLIVDIQRITVEEICECVVSYTMSRQGSRKIYKLLELIIKHRFKDIKANPAIAQKIYIHYSKSGLCSSETLAQLEIIM